MGLKTGYMLNIETGYSVAQLAAADEAETIDLTFDTADPALKGANQFTRNGHYALICAGGPITRPDYAEPMASTAIRAGYNYLENLELKNQAWDTTEAEAALTGLVRHIEPELEQKSRDLRGGRSNTDMSYEGSTVGAALLYNNKRNRLNLGLVNAGDTTIAYYNEPHKDYYVVPSSDENLRTEYSGSATISTEILPLKLGKNRVILHQGFGRSDLSAMPDIALVGHSKFQDILRNFSLESTEAARRIIEIPATDLFYDEALEPDGRLAYVIDINLSKKSVLSRLMAIIKKD